MAIQNELGIICNIYLKFVLVLQNFYTKGPLSKLFLKAPDFFVTPLDITISHFCHICTTGSTPSGLSEIFPRTRQSYPSSFHRNLCHWMKSFQLELHGEIVCCMQFLHQYFTTLLHFHFISYCLPIEIRADNPWIGCS